MADFSYSIDLDGIATIDWNVPKSQLNVLTLSGLETLESIIDEVLENSKIKGVIITSMKKDFSGGMDLKMLSKFESSKENSPSSQIYDLVMRLHRMLRKLELAGMDPKTKKGGKPVVWACPGISAGIGTEIGLACHHRLVADTERAKIGLPEIMVGLFPGGGGTTRLVRMLGLMASAALLFEGKLMKPNSAKSAGLVDELVNPDKLLVRAKTWILEATEIDIIKPWDSKNYKMPGGFPYHPTGFMTFAGASAMIKSKSKGVYPAPQKLLSAIYEGSLTSFDNALKIEARWFTNILMQPSTSNMIRSLFVNKAALEKGLKRPENVPSQKVVKLAVIGAGMMGSGIAQSAATAGIKVILLDKDKIALKNGLSKIESILDEAVKKKSINQDKKSYILNNVLASTDYSELTECDMVIEAVFEDPKIKEIVIASASKYIGKDTVFASNTSTLPISKLAKHSKDPSQFLGIHFFSPVHKMKLVEVIKGDKTEQKAIAKALDFIKQIHKTPIVVNDSRNFYANRCIIPYLNEGMCMVGEGIAPIIIENAAQQLGMPVGPLQLIDETSIDLGVSIANATKKALGKDYQDIGVEKVLFKMFEIGRLGRKVKAGFYEYSESGKRVRLWSGLKAEWQDDENQTSFEEVKNRLALVQCLEAVRALENNVLLDIREGDVGAILGWGCMPWAGGPFGWLDLKGSETIIKICDKLEITYGKRYQAPNFLKELNKKNQGFYEVFNY